MNLLQCLPYLTCIFIIRKLNLNSKNGHQQNCLDKSLKGASHYEGLKSLISLLQIDKFVDYEYCNIADLIILICNVTSRVHVFKGFNNFLSGAPMLVKKYKSHLLQKKLFLRHFEPTARVQVLKNSVKDQFFLSSIHLFDSTKIDKMHHCVEAINLLNNGCY